MIAQKRRLQRRPGATSIPLACLLTLAGCSATQPLHVVTGLTSHVLCSETFVSGLDPQEVYAETIKPMPGIHLMSGGLRYDVDREHRQVTATLFGDFESRAVYRDGLGCLLVHGDAPVDSPTRNDIVVHAPLAPPVLPPIAGPVVVEPTDAKLRAILDEAFAEPNNPPDRQTKAVVIVHKGRVVAERYAPGHGIDTPLLSFSAVKSVMSALVGILVRDGRLSVYEPAPIAAWHESGDPRRAITVDQLLRHTSGLALSETNSGFDAWTRVQFLERDMAAAVQAAPLEAAPGSRWSYTSANYILLSRIVRDAVGGDAIDVLSFANRELFGPLGMRTVTLEFDATGTPVGSTYMLASARDWARFGMLYLNDGVIGARRILPEGWVRYSSSPTPGATLGYGAGFYTNLGDSEGAARRRRLGMPADSFFAHGTLGQVIVIVPSAQLVVVRFGAAQQWPRFDIEDQSRLVRDAVAALK